jgi:hypothetical protein
LNKKVSLIMQVNSLKEEMNKWLMRKFKKN